MLNGRMVRQKQKTVKIHGRIIISFRNQAAAAEFSASAQVRLSVENFVESEHVLGESTYSFSVNWMHSKQ